MDPIERAREADEIATTLRVHLRVARDKGLLTDEQLLFAADRLDNIGRQIGGWRKRLEGTDEARGRPREQQPS